MDDELVPLTDAEAMDEAGMLLAEDVEWNDDAVLANQRATVLIAYARERRRRGET